MSELLFKNFELLADAPNCIQKLRELILQLAVQGKLVPQDPNDEPASVLLEKIKAWKNRLIEESKINRSSRIPPIDPGEVPYELPKKWAWARFGEVTEFEVGKTPATKEESYWTMGSHSWVSISDMKDGGTITSTARHITDVAVKRVFRKPPVETGTLLMSFKLTLGKVSLLGAPAYHNEAIISVYPHGGRVKSYLFKVLPKVVGLGASKNAIKGETLNRKSLVAMPFPLPPTAEQKRIVTKVDQLMALCDELEERQKKKHEIRIRLNDSALDKLLNVHDPGDLAHNWKRISNNFDLLYDHPETVGKLRQAILQLAVQGKLVPQGPTDEPASVLLEKIKSEKEKLIKEGKLRASRSLPTIKFEDLPFHLPTMWVPCRLTGC